MLGDRPQVWEINTNPNSSPNPCGIRRSNSAGDSVQGELSSIIGGCLNELDTAGDASGQSTERKIVVKEFVKLLNWA